MERDELERAVAGGLSLGQLSSTFGRSKGSIRYWLTKYQLRTVNRAKRESTPEAKAARAAGAASFVQECSKHGPTRFLREASGYYRCTRCRNERVSKRRRRLKEILLVEAGGACTICGYARSKRALEFHHVEPTEKEFAVSAAGATMSIEELRAEVQKCVLLCSNCHAEVEDGVVSVSVK